jgi:tRNA G18 (ribose-2'-O)-methylase SpoU
MDRRPVVPRTTGWPLWARQRLDRLAVARFASESSLCFDPTMNLDGSSLDKRTMDDFEDSHLDVYRNLKDSTLAGKRGRFIVEGRGNLLVLLTRSSYRPESILLSERTFASIESELASLKPDCPVFVANRSVMDRVVGFPIHRGCLAACRREESSDPIELARRALERESAPRLIVLEHLTNLDNVGLIFRNAMAFGARAILLCSRSCDPLYRKAIRTSMGGSLCVPFARTEDFPRMLSELSALGYEVLAFDPGAEGAANAGDVESVEIGSLQQSGVRTARPIGPAALLFGTEGPGLSEAALSHSDRRVWIAMEPGVDSLNVGVAAGIGLSMLRCLDPTRTDGNE